jgi:hypothetical protein
LDVLRKVAPVILAALVVTTLLPGGVASSRPHRHRGHHHLLQGGDPLAPLAGQDGFPDRKNGDGQKLSAGRAVAHYAGGVPITDNKIVSKAPDGRFYRLGINGWEPSMGVDSKGRIFYQARNADLRPQVMRSTNEGDTWEMVSPMIAGAPAQPISLDPVMYLDKDTDRVFTNNIPPDVTCQYVSFTDNAGESWTNTGICGHFDHQNIFTGPPPEGGDAPSGYPNVAYYCAINLVALSGTSTATTCGKSLDGGMTWLPSGEPAYITPIPPREDQTETYCDGAVGHGFVGDDGTVFLPRVWCGQAFLSISKDEGFTWDSVQVAKNGGIGHEAGVAADSKGNVYYTWVAADKLPYLAVSRDNGETWGKPMMIGSPTLKRASLPAMDIGDDGKIAITYVGSETPGKDREKWKWNAYITMSANASAQEPVFYSGPVNAESHPLHIGNCGAIRCHTLGDFFDVVIAPDGTVWISFVDACFDPDNCIASFENIGVRGEAVVGRFVGGPKLR